MAVITVQSIVAAGLTPTFAAASSGGDTAINNGQMFLYVRNGHASAARQVTIDSLVNCDQGTDHNIVVSVPGGPSEEMIGPFQENRFSDPDGTGIQITYDDEADLTIAAIQLGA